MLMAHFVTVFGHSKHLPIRFFSVVMYDVYEYFLCNLPHVVIIIIVRVIDVVRRLCNHDICNYDTLAHVIYLK